MKQTVTEHDFRRAFEDLRPDNFSYEGLGALYEYLTDLEDAMGEEFELDVIGICCDFSEMSIEEMVKEYDYTLDLLDIDKNDDDAVISAIADETTIFEVAHPIYIIQDF